MSFKSKWNKYMKSQAVCHLLHLVNWPQESYGNLCLTFHHLKSNLSIQLTGDYVPYKIKIWIVIGNDKYYIYNSLNKMRIKICHFIFCPDYIYIMCIFKFRRDQFKYFSSCALFPDSLALKPLEQIKHITSGIT